MHNPKVYSRINRARDVYGTALMYFWDPLLVVICFAASLRFLLQLQVASLQQAFAWRGRLRLHLRLAHARSHRLCFQAFIEGLCTCIVCSPQTQPVDRALLAVLLGLLAGSFLFCKGSLPCLVLYFLHLHLYQHLARQYEVAHLQRCTFAVLSCRMQSFQQILFLAEWQQTEHNRGSVYSVNPAWL